MFGEYVGLVLPCMVPSFQQSAYLWEQGSRGRRNKIRELPKVSTNWQNVVQASKLCSHTYLKCGPGG